MANSSTNEAGDGQRRFDYETYIRMRRLNVALTKWTPWVMAWLVFGSFVAAAGYMSREESNVVGMDPGGRAHRLQILQITNSQGK